MPSLIPDTQKLILGEALNNVFLTFVRPLTIWKTADIVIVSSDPNNINFIYGNDQAGIVTQTIPVSGTFDGSISWGEPNAYNQNEIRPNINGSLCQVDLLRDGYDFISGYNQIVVDGVSCSINPENPYPRQHGLFDTRYFCVYLRRNN